MKKYIFILFAILYSFVFSLTALATCIDFSEKSNVTVSQLENSLFGDLSNLSKFFLQAEEKYNVNAITFSALAAVESGWGESELSKEYNNLFGWRNSDGSYMVFDSKEECIMTVARSIREMYLDENGIYYSGGTKISDVANYYNPNKEWVELITNMSYEIKERCDMNEETKNVEQYQDFNARVVSRISDSAKDCGIPFQLCKAGVFQYCECGINSSKIES